ncbi:FAD/NAD(P)-binding domain-containing protein [Coprinopsis marcescibilis]|uniref:FAD/NAD(P)-binding domain-containing protein n=1 Tax=Coprinopsis marcescibilis TaxID=230819 RepID=A0A5C3KUZ3_COPMA|nr:FAD/NAD(P)-binding domain-containing protein [Coprinopsis marcescibilis]
MPDGSNTPAAPPSSTTSPLDPFPIDYSRPMKVAVIGAGYTGIIAAVRFPQKVSNLEFVVYEANAGVGGVWYSHRYPGLACDVPSHCYQLSFEPNSNWSSFHPEGPEIQQYLEGVVDKYKLWPYIKLQHRLVHARYDEEAGKWHLKIRRPKYSAHNGTDADGNNANGAAEVEWEEFEDIVDIVLSGMGALCRWDWPKIDGLTSFKGKLIHTAEWETGEGDPKAGWKTTVSSWSDKKIGVIGISSSAAQIVPSLQPIVSKLVNYGRSKTWVVAPFGHDKVQELAKNPRATDYYFTDEDKEAFKDPAIYTKFRKEIEQRMQSGYPLLFRGSPMQQHVRNMATQMMKQKLAKKPEIAEALIPDYPVGCGRPVPDAGYLGALCQDNVDYVSTPIAKVTETGIETVDGNHKELDVIICATGYDLSFDYRLPIIGRNGLDLKDAWGSGASPETYLSLAASSFPNWFQSLGPNGAVPGGSLTLVLEKIVEYVVEVTLKLQRDRYKSIEVKKEAVNAFDRFAQGYFPKTVFSLPFKSFFKANSDPNGKISVIWPGTPLHYVKALKHPRWEDFTYERSVKDNDDSAAWLGDGTTLANMDPNADRAWYIDPENIDFPKVPE